LGSDENGSLRIGAKIRAILPPAALFVSLVFLFGPFTIYKGNIIEFSLPFGSILDFFLIPASVLFFVMIGVGLILPGNFHRRYVVLIFIMGVLIWVQGNILVWEYGLVNGQAIDWTKGAWRGWADTAFWLIPIGVGAFFYGKIYKAVILAGSVLFLLQTANLAFESYQNPRIWHANALSGHNFLSKEICEFSSKQNVLHIILDGFQSSVFGGIIQDDLPYYRNALEGFTFFSEATGAFPTTRLSVPAFLSGAYYRNDMPMDDFLMSVFRGQNILRTLYEADYDIDLIGAVRHIVTYTDIPVTSYEIPIPYNVSLHEYKLANSALMMDLVFFRAAPHFLKKHIYNNQSWLVQQLLYEKGYALTFFRAHSLFLDDFMSHMTAKGHEPLYKYIHLENTHPPFVVGKDCEYAGQILPIAIENAKTQDKCALDQVIRLFEKLKQEDVYDDALIILQADHGIGLSVEMDKSGTRPSEDIVPSLVVGGALPLLAIKPPHRRGPLTISNAQAMLSDIPATICALLNLKHDFPGVSAFDIDPVADRERRYCYYQWRHEHWQADFLDRLDEYFIQGSVYAASSWVRGTTYFPPSITDYQIDKIDFGTVEATKFKRSGWGGDEQSADGAYTFNWALGDAASIHLSIPKNNPVFLVANIASYDSGNSQNITVKLDGHVIGSWELTVPWQLTKKQIRIAPDKERPDVSIVEFAFSHHRTPKRKERPVAVMFESIILREEKGTM
jgi:hypothetical protein